MHWLNYNNKNYRLNLTHLSQMDTPSLINWTNPFLLYIYIQILIEHSVSKEWWVVLTKIWHFKSHNGGQGHPCIISSSCLNALHMHLSASLWEIMKARKHHAQPLWKKSLPPPLWERGLKLEPWQQITNNVAVCHDKTRVQGAQWLSGRVLDSRLKGRRFEPHRRHCVVVLEQDTFILA